MGIVKKSQTTIVGCLIFKKKGLLNRGRYEILGGGNMDPSSNYCTSLQIKNMYPGLLEGHIFLSFLKTTYSVSASFGLGKL